MGQPPRIKSFRPSKSLLKSASIGRLVSHRPNDNCRSVFISVHAPLCPVHNRFCICRIIGNYFVPLCTAVLPAFILKIYICYPVALIIRLIDYIETILIAQFQKLRRIRIMASPHRIHIMLFHHHKICFHLFHTDSISGHRITIMPIHSVKFHRNPVNSYHSSTDRNRPYSNSVSDDLSAALIYSCIQVRIFCMPKFCILNIEVYFGAAFSSVCF